MNAIIILNYCTYDDVVKCVKSIDENELSDLNIYIVDNNSPDGSGERLLETFKGRSKAKVILNDKNQGYSAGNNIGIKYALQDKCEYIIICNPDIVFHSNSIEQLISSFNQNERIGLVGPKIFNEDGSVYLFGQRKKITELRELYLLKYPFSYLNLMDVKDKMFYKLDQLDQQLNVFTVSGSCFAISSKAAKVLYPLDENIFMYMEESNIGKILRENALEAVYNPNAKVIHNHRIDKKLISPFSLVHKCASEIYYIIDILVKSKIYTVPILLYYYFVFAVGMVTRKDYRNMFRYLLLETNKAYKKSGKNVMGVKK